MAIPSGIGVIDLMMQVPTLDTEAWYRFLRPQLQDAESRERFRFPAEYMFKNIPSFEPGMDPVKAILQEMDRHGVAKSMINVNSHMPDAQRALREHPDRFFGAYEVNPNKGMDAVRKIVSMHESWGIKAVTLFPAGLIPQVPINDKKLFPIYARCVELDIPICCCVGVPGPRVPFAPQRVELIDEVCAYFPELKFVMRHGAEPWTDLAVKLMLKWPNLHYSTSAFAPRYYPRDVVDYANTRGADRVMYAGYFPMGLSLDRIFAELEDVPFREHVWPRFLRENALRVFRLDD